MRQIAVVQKKCLRCGHIYENCDMIFGVHKCPKCFRAENFEYVDQHGRAMPDFTPHKLFDGDADYRDDRDDGCKLATLWFGTEVKCVEQCPFKPDCAEWLGKSHRAIIVKILKRRAYIKTVYLLFDLGMRDGEIVKLTNLSRGVVAWWKVRRGCYEPIIKYGDISGFLPKPKRKRNRGGR
jgi:hypothetical protein